MIFRTTRKKKIKSNYNIILLHMLTSIKNDDLSIQRQMEISSFSSRYHLNVPGPGINVGYIENPHIRLQYWAANLYSNQIDLENELSNRYRKNTTQEKKTFNPMHRYVNPSQINSTIESRTELPAWIYRDKESRRESIIGVIPHEIQSYDTIYSRLLPKTQNKPSSF